MKKTIGVIVLLSIAAVTFVYSARAGSGDVSLYRQVAVERGNVEHVISATGTLGAVTTVQVGTQVSGIVSEIFVDFNDEVAEGQILAILDTTLLGIAVRDAEASVERVQAQLRHAEREFERADGLFQQEMITEVEIDQARYNLDVARASASSAAIALERAERNLAYATVYAPISGTVIERKVDVGQTVAASLSAPQLFLIANDLSRMQILASVDESDISLIEEGQTARFTVQAYPDEHFTGTVRQVRLQSISQENVVNYAVVVDVDNGDGRLLPGMTATVDFLVAVATDVTKVANAALRFSPTEEMLTEMKDGAQGDRVDQSVSRPSTTSRTGGDGARPGNAAMLWYLDADGRLAVTRVRTGISDGQYAEIQAEGLEPGLLVIAGFSQSGQSSTSNPFQSQQEGQRGRGF